MIEVSPTKLDTWQDCPFRYRLKYVDRVRVDGAWAAYPIELAPRDRWELVIDVVPSPVGDVVHPAMAERPRSALSRVRPAVPAAWPLAR